MGIKFVEKSEILDLQAAVKELQNLTSIKQENEDIRSNMNNFSNDFSTFVNQTKEKLGNIEKELSKFVITGKL